MADLNPISDKPQDVLQRATAALRAQAGLNEPPAVVVLKTLAALGSSRRESRSLPGRRFTMITLKRSAWGAGIAAGVIIAFIIVMQLTLPSALAQALEKVREIKSVRYKENVTTPDMKAPQRSTTVEETVTVVDPAWTDVETPASTIITDYKAGKTLTLDPKAKFAVRMTLANVPKEEQENILEKLRNVDEKHATYLGEKEMDGHKTREYQYQKKGETGAMETKIWIDPETRLPVRMEMDGQVGICPNMHMVATDFQWDVKVDKGLLNLDVPEGYRVAEGTADVASATEKDLLEAFKTAAENNGGKFPEEFNSKGFMSPLEVRTHDITKIDSKAINVMLQHAAVMLRGLQFAGLPGQTDMHYAGKGVTLGDATRPIFWYRTKGKDVYRIIDGSLAVKEIKLGDLPQVESVVIDPAKLIINPTIQPGAIPGPPLRP